LLRIRLRASLTTILVRSWKKIFNNHCLQKQLIDI
jgi:hypothetical protein